MQNANQNTQTIQRDAAMLRKDLLNSFINLHEQPVEIEQFYDEVATAALTSEWANDPQKRKDLLHYSQMLRNFMLLLEEYPQEVWKKALKQESNGKNV